MASPMKRGGEATNRPQKKWAEEEEEARLTTTIFGAPPLESTLQYSGVAGAVTSHHRWNFSYKVSGREKSSCLQEGEAEGRKEGRKE